jgi:hypothetical protein
MPRLRTTGRRPRVPKRVIGAFVAVTAVALIVVAVSWASQPDPRDRVEAIGSATPTNGETSTAGPDATTSITPASSVSAPSVSTIASQPTQAAAPPAATPPAATPTPPAPPTPPAATPPPAPVVPPKPGGPVRAAFYYPWFPEAWDQSGINPFTHYHPSLGFYNGASSSVVASQIQAMQYGKISVGIASWWGQGSQTNAKMPLLLSTAAGTGFHWAIYYEPEGTSDPSAAQIASDLAYINSHYGPSPSLYKVNGKPVIFVYAQPADGCGMAGRWAQANSSGADYVVLKVFTGHAACAAQPNDWHQYSPAVADDRQAGHSYSISPGFWLANSTQRLGRDLARWQQSVRNMVASREPWQLVTTFNEWGEGTAVESASEWSSASGYGAYLDVLHNN